MVPIFKAIGHFILHQQGDVEVQLFLGLGTILPLLKLPPGV